MKISNLKSQILNGRAATSGASARALSFSRLLVFSLVALCASAPLRLHAAGFRITTILTLTNNANLTNGIQLTLNSDVRTGEDIVTNAATQFARSNRIDHATTNLLAHLTAHPFANCSIGTSTATNNIVLVGFTNVPMVASFFGAWGNVTNITNLVYGASPLTTPYTVELNPFRIWQQDIVSTNLAYVTVAANPTWTIFDKLIGLDFATQTATNKSFADGNLYDFVIVDPFLEGSATFSSAANFTFLLNDLFYVEFSEPTISGQLWNLKDGTTNPKDDNTIARYGDFLSDQFAFDTNSGAIYFKERGQSTNTFLETPHLSAAGLSNDTRLLQVKMVGDSGDSLRMFLPDASTLTASLTINTDGRPELEDTLLGIGLIPSISNPKELMTLNGLLNWSPMLNQVSGGPPTNWWVIPNYFQNPTYFRAAVDVSAALSAATLQFSNLIGSNWISGHLGLQAGAYSALGNGAATTNVVQLDTNTITVISGNTADASIISMKDAPNPGRFAITINGSSFNQTFLHESTLETVPERRLQLPGSASATIASKGAALWWYNNSAQRWNLLSPQPLTTLTIINTTNQITFGATNSPPANTATVRKWISAQVTGETNAYRIPVYE